MNAASAIGQSVFEFASRALPARATRLAVHHSSATPEHYTPRDVLLLVERVFGGIPDLDPCSNSHTHPNVTARRHYTQADNGLAQPWSGRVFLNPPYGKEVLPPWIRKLRTEWRRGEMTELIALLPARPDTRWFYRVTLEADALCFIQQRLKFVGNTSGAPFPSMLIYFGPRREVFIDAFRDRGTFWQQESQLDRGGV